MERLPAALLKKKIVAYKKKECKNLPKTKKEAIKQIKAINKRKPDTIKFSATALKAASAPKPRKKAAKKAPKNPFANYNIEEMPSLRKRTVQEANRNGNPFFNL